MAFLSVVLDLVLELNITVSDRFLLLLYYY